MSVLKHPCKYLKVMRNFEGPSAVFPDTEGIETHLRLGFLVRLRLQFSLILKGLRLNKGFARHQNLSLQFSLILKGLRRMSSALSPKK